MNRVVITGYGVTSAIGNTPEEFWNGLKSGKTGIGPITRFDAEATGISVAAEVKDFPFEKHFEKKDARRMDTFSLYAVYAALEAMEMSGITPENTNYDRLGCIMASGIGGLEQTQKNSQALLKGPRKVTPLYVPLAIANMATGNVALRTGARGVSRAEVTACAAGTHSVGDAFEMIKNGRAKAMIAGGTEAAITPFAMNAFANMKALSTRNDEPQKASRPFTLDRDGFVMGILILEELESAKKRGAKIYAEIVGYGETCDAYHITAPVTGGEGAARAFKMALKEGNIDLKDVGYINAHGTSTPANDSNETAAIKAVFGEHAKELLVSSTKGATGHGLGSAGGMEAVIIAKVLSEGIVPPTINYDNPDPECDLNYVPNKAVKKDIEVAMSSSLGFGGHNAVIAMRKYK